MEQQQVHKIVDGFQCLQFYSVEVVVSGFVVVVGVVVHNVGKPLGTTAPIVAVACRAHHIAGTVQCHRHIGEITVA